jgi:8-oxo-dGTP pyrophosphatase MutT (NUDIX family)
LASLLESCKRRLFWIVARFCFAGYRAFPIFGSLRASIGIIHNEGRFLVIQRNDGRGLSLPGGIAARNEPEESTLRREVREETGLEVRSLSFRVRFHSKADVPCNISVFEVDAHGELKDSWEGSPRWMTIGELEPRLIESQKPTLELMKQISAGTQQQGR